MKYARQRYYLLHKRASYLFACHNLLSKAGDGQGMINEPLIAKIPLHELNCLFFQ